MTELTYAVPAIHCEHCALSIREEVSEVPGVESVEVDPRREDSDGLGREVSDELVRAAIVEAGSSAMTDRAARRGRGPTVPPKERADAQVGVNARGRVRETGSSRAEPKAREAT